MRIFTTVVMMNLLVFAGAAHAERLLSTPQEAATAAQANTVKDKDCTPLPAADGTKLGLIRQMLTAGKPHAAIAYLDEARLAVPQADLLRADGLRQTGRMPEAAQIYRRLLTSCVAGYAYQGLGLIANKLGKTQEAVTNLRAASAALPIEASIRNDYGYALMLAGDNTPALHEFLTAIELLPDNRQIAYNLILLLFRSGDDARAKAFAAKFGITGDELTRLQQMAQQPLPEIAAASTLPAQAVTTKEAAILDTVSINQHENGGQ